MYSVWQFEFCNHHSDGQIILHSGRIYTAWENYFFIGNFTIEDQHLTACSSPIYYAHDNENAYDIRARQQIYLEGRYDETQMQLTATHAERRYNLQLQVCDQISEELRHLWACVRRKYWLPELTEAKHPKISQEYYERRKLAELGPLPLATRWLAG